MVSQGGRPNSTARFWGLDVNLTAPGQCVADQGPAYQIGAVVYRSSWEIFKGGCYEEKVILHADNGRVGIKSGNNRIVVHDDSSPIYIVDILTKNGMRVVCPRYPSIYSCVLQHDTLMP